MDFELQAAVLNFENLLKSCERLHAVGNNVARALCALYAMRCARAVLTCIPATIDINVDGSCNLSNSKGICGAGTSLPDHKMIHSISQALVEALNSGDKAATLSVLEQMGIIELCTMPERQLSRIEIMISGLTRQAKSILLAELAVFAAELGDYKKASKYVTDAYALAPGASELHDLISIEGVAALSEGNLDTAVECLARSVSVCLVDEYACLSCGVRAPNLMLVEKLLECGERASVVKFLIDCQDVWERRRHGFSELIGAIQNGRVPELRAAGLLGARSRPSARILDLYARACLPGFEPHSSTPKSRSDVIKGRERLRAQYKGLMSGAIKGKLGTSNN